MIESLNDLGTQACRQIENLEIVEIVGSSRDSAKDRDSKYGGHRRVNKDNRDGGDCKNCKDSRVGGDSGK